jgi:hypothetical protein
MYKELANLVLCGVALVRFPDGGRLPMETCSNVECDIVIYIQGDSGGICTTLGDDSMSDSKQKGSYEHGSDF